jgi:type II secretory pathway pseudopilin PulG
VKTQSKAARGMGYIEVVVATALFLILLAATLPIITHATQGLAYARGAYQAHLEAQRILYRAREAFPEIPTYPNASITHISPFAQGDFPVAHTGIVVLVYNRHGHPWGRAAGIVIHSHEGE